MATMKPITELRWTGGPLRGKPITGTESRASLGSYVDPKTYRGGFHLFTSEAASDANGVSAAAKGVDAQKPGIIRWTFELQQCTSPLEWDWQNNRWKTPYHYSFDTYLPFLQACARNGVRLIIQFWIGPNPGGAWLWSTLGYPNNGVAALQPAWDQNYFTTVDYYRQFVRDLVALARKAYGAVSPVKYDLISVEAWNEPDIDWWARGVFGPPRTTIMMNADPINVNPDNYNSWTGGYRPGTTTKWGSLHRVLDDMPEHRWGSNGVASSGDIQYVPGTKTISPWIYSALDDKKITFIEYHNYFSFYSQQPPADPLGFVNGTIYFLNIWDTACAERGVPVLPFVIGETNFHATGDDPKIDSSVPLAQALRQAHYKLRELYPTRYQGTCLIGGTPWKFSKGWWDPTYSAT